MKFIRKISLQKVLFCAGVVAAVVCPFMTVEPGAAAIATGLAAVALLKASEILKQG